MKYLPLIIRNVMRNKIRSLFTGASIAVSLFLVVFLHSILSSGDELSERKKMYNRVAILSEAGLAGNLPIAYVDRIRKLEGVEAAIPMSWFGGKYQDEKVPFTQFGTDAERFFDVYQELEFPSEQLEAWRNDKGGCVIGALMAEKRGWKIGDSIVIKGDIYPVNLELTIRGVYDGPSTADLEWLLFHFDYLDNALKERLDPFAGNAGIVMLRAQSTDKITSVMQSAESAFGSSDSPVQALTEKQFEQSFIEMLGNVRGFIRFTSIAVIVALLCVAANTMAMSLRERTREIALLKAIGFSQSTVLGLFLFESVLIGALGGAAGAFGAKALFGPLGLSKQMPNMSLFYIPLTTALAGVGLAAGIGLLSGVVPAWRAAHVSVVDGLRKVV